MAPPELAEFREEPLGSRHDRAGFTCGVESLDRYLKTQASQDMRRKANAVFVLVPVEQTSRVAAFYTLCATSLAPGAVPEAARKHAPRYPLVSATLLGRLAVAREHHGKGVGRIVLACALRKAYENAAIVGSCMVVVDAIDEEAAGFYEAHGFVRLTDCMRLILPIRQIGELVGP